jgi:N-acetylmuramoyl-L-alanine amidase
MKTFSCKMYALAGVLLVLCMQWSCSRNPYATTNKSYRQQAKALSKMVRSEPGPDSLPPAYWVGTTNFGLRKPNYVIIHHTAQHSCEQTLGTFTMPKNQVSAHYVVCRDGIVHHMLNDYLRAWHAGASQWGGNTDINSSSIGIEIDNDGSEPFSEVQISSLLHLLGRLKKDYGIPASHFIGHSDIAPGRKVDPSKFFPWQQLATNGYGMWYSDTTNIQVPDNFNTLQALRLLGYNCKDSSAAISSFKLHFVPTDSTRMVTDADRKILFGLLTKYE